MKLRPDVKFHDGTEFDGPDVKFSLERINDPALESTAAAVLGIISGVEVADPLTAKITLSNPHAGLSMLLYDYRVVMLPSEAGDTITRIGTGPFKLDSFDPESTTEVVANPDYWGEALKPDRITPFAIPGSAARNQAMLGLAFG